MLDRIEGVGTIPLMAFTNWIERTTQGNHQLPLHSFAQALEYLSIRPRLMCQQARSSQGHNRRSVERDQDALWRLDRAAAFWVAAAALPQTRKRGVALFGPRGSQTAPRAYDLAPASHRIELGSPWLASHPLVTAVEFSSEALLNHGALTVCFPLTKEALEQQFGPGAWQSCQRQASEERARRLTERWTATVAPTPERARL